MPGDKSSAQFITVPFSSFSLGSQLLLVQGVMNVLEYQFSFLKVFLDKTMDNMLVFN